MPEGFISHSFADNSTGFKIEKTEGDITTTILFDNDLNVVGEAIENTATGISFSETKTVSADGKTYTLAGDNDTGQTDKALALYIMLRIIVWFQAPKLLTASHTLMLQMAHM